jgi:hypothetical protein
MRATSLDLPHHRDATSARGCGFTGWTFGQDISHFRFYKTIK